MTTLFRVVVAFDPATGTLRLRRRPMFGWRRRRLVSDASVVTAVFLAANVVVSIGVRQRRQNRRPSYLLGRLFCTSDPVLSPLVCLM